MMKIARQIWGVAAAALLIGGLTGCSDTESPAAAKDEIVSVGVVTLTIAPSNCKTNGKDELSDDLKVLCADTIRCRAFFDSIEEEEASEDSVQVPGVGDMVFRKRWLRTGPTRWEFEDNAVAAILGPLLESQTLIVMASYPEQAGVLGRQSWEVSALDLTQGEFFDLLRWALDDPPKDGGFPEIGNSIEFAGEFKYVNVSPDRIDVDAMSGWGSARIENLRSVPAE